MIAGVAIAGSGIAVSGGAVGGRAIGGVAVDGSVVGVGAKGEREDKVDDGVESDDSVSD